jgi:hypothetical protein
MNITHNQDSEQQVEEECSYLIANSIAKQSKKAPDEPLLSKILELLDDSTPNYVLGYN